MASCRDKIGSDLSERCQINNCSGEKDDDVEYGHEHGQKHMPSELSKSWCLEESMMVVHDQMERLQTCSDHPKLIKEKLDVLEPIKTQ